MEVSRFFTSKPFNKTPDLVPTLKPKFPFWHKKRPNRGFYYYGYGGGVSHSFTCCNFRAELPDDSSEPTIESDWRSFRARLVAKEQASTLAGSTTPLPSDAPDQSPTPRILGDKWAHPLREPEKGCLLIATEKLDGVHIFERTVILVLSNGPMGPTGIIIYRPSLMSIKETRSTDLDLTGTFSSRPLFFGGPLEEGLFLVGPQEGEDKVGRSGVFEEVMEGLYYGTKESVGCAAEMVKRNVVGVGDFKFFDGYCGWQKEQLRDEIRGGLWTVAACSPSVIGLMNVVAVGSGRLWEEVLGLVGETKLHDEEEQANARNSPARRSHQQLEPVDSPTADAGDDGDLQIRPLCVVSTRQDAPPFPAVHVSPPSDGRIGVPDAIRTFNPS